MTPPRRYFRFVRQYGDERVSFKCDGDASLDDLIDTFEAFLKGCGYEFYALDCHMEAPKRLGDE
jgi:hypothetical protein